MSHHKHRSRSSSCSSDSRYKRKRSRRHSYRRSKSNSSTSGSSVTSVSSKNFDNKSSVNQNTAWENIVLHYLSKLKNYWTSVYNSKPASARTSQVDNAIAVKDEEQLNLVTELPPFVQENYCQLGKRKALNIVSNALEYGLANGIVSQNGNYFWIRDKLVPKDKISNPRMPPSKCESCNCNSLSKTAIIEKKSSTVSPPKVAQSKKSVKAKGPKTRGTKRAGVLSAGKLRKKRAPACSGFLNKCKCSKCKSIFKLL